MAFSKQLSEARGARGLSRAKLASLADVTYAYIRQLETGERGSPKAETLTKLAQALGLTTDELLRGDFSGSQPSDESSDEAERAWLRREIESMLSGFDVALLQTARDVLRALQKSNRSTASKSTP